MLHHAGHLYITSSLLYLWISLNVTVHTKQITICTIAGLHNWHSRWFILYVPITRCTTYTRMNYWKSITTYNYGVCVTIFCSKIGPWHPNSALFILPYELGNFTYQVVSHCHLHFRSVCVCLATLCVCVCVCVCGCAGVDFLGWKEQYR